MLRDVRIRSEIFFLFLCHSSIWSTKFVRSRTHKKTRIKFVRILLDNSMFLFTWLDHFLKRIFRLLVLSFDAFLRRVGTRPIRLQTARQMIEPTTLLYIFISILCGGAAMQSQRNVEEIKKNDNNDDDVVATP